MTAVCTARSPSPRPDLAHARAGVIQEGPLRLDLSTLTEAYGEHGSAVYGLAYHILRDHPAAEDVAHDTFLKFWTGASQFDPTRGPMRGLLLTMVRHKAIDWMRRVARCQRSESAYCASETFVSDGPEQATERGEDARVLRSALMTLPFEQRRVIEMAYFGDLTFHQIAGEMRVPIGTVKSRMRLGMRKLALTLGDGRWGQDAPVRRTDLQRRGGAPTSALRADIQPPRCACRGLTKQAEPSP